MSWDGISWRGRATWQEDSELQRTDHPTNQLTKKRGSAPPEGGRSRAECPRPDEATSDTSCRCYLRGPDGVRRLPPSGTWDDRNVIAWAAVVKRRVTPRA